MREVDEHLYLDAWSLAYRAFFALPQSITDPQGRPVNAVRGFIDMLADLLTGRRPAGVTAVFDDDWRPAFRVNAFPGYKADRPPDPPELLHQFGVLEEVLDAAGISRAIAPDLEADDAIATLVDDPPETRRHLIVTGDRDMLGLVRDPTVAVLFTVKGVRNLHEFDEAAVQDKYGVPPRLYPDFASLRGDPSDGLPGVVGIGPVRAAKLLGRYGSIDGVLAHLNELPERQAQAFESAREYLAAMKTVVTLVRDAPIDATETGAPDEARISELIDEHGLGGSGRRFAQALGT